MLKSQLELNDVVIIQLCVFVSYKYIDALHLRNV